MYIDKQILKPSDVISLKSRELYTKYGYKQYRMQKFEEVSLYLDNKDFLESTSLITFNDLDGKLLALKPDVTLSIVKNTLENIVGVERLFYLESVYRVSKQANKYCEIKQMGLEAIGEIDSLVTAEVVELALTTLNEVDSNFVLDLSHVDFVSGLLEYLGLGYKSTKAIQECLISKNASEAKALLERKKASAEAIDAVVKIIELRGDCKKVLDESKKLVKNDLMAKAVKELEEIVKIFENSPFKDNLRIDYSIINNTKYYNGIVFQGFVPKIPAALLLGGKYGNIFLGYTKAYDAIGFAINLDLLNTYYQPYKTLSYDVLLVYGNANPSKALEKARELRKDGQTVIALKEDLGNIKCKTKIDLN